MTNAITHELENRLIVAWHSRGYSQQRIKELLPHRTAADIRALVRGVPRNRQNARGPAERRRPAH